MSRTISFTPLSAILVVFSTMFATEIRPAVAEATPEGGSSGELTLDEFTRLHQKLTKMSTERVWSIPWQLSVRKARELAARENKPVFLWISSNGGTHPLGPC